MGAVIIAVIFGGLTGVLGGYLGYRHARSEFDQTEAMLKMFVKKDLQVFEDVLSDVRMMTDYTSDTFAAVRDSNDQMKQLLFYLTEDDRK